MGAMAYGGHRKAAVEWTEGRASAASALLLRSNTVRDKKSNDESLVFTHILVVAIMNVILFF